MRKIKFMLSACSIAAGRYDADAPNNGNEDAIYVDDNLSDDEYGHCVSDASVDLSDKGMLMVVSDGMGGLNAGNVASQMAIDTIKEYFIVDRLTPSVMISEKTRQEYVESVFAVVNQRIKDTCEQEHKDMGCTLIVAWLLGSRLMISWCGDSRAYLYRPSSGLVLLMEDHTVAQRMVNENTIAEEDLFQNIYGSVLTYCLCGDDNHFKVDTRSYDVQNSDIILLCSDGLNGVLRDRYLTDVSNENLYNDPSIEEVLEMHQLSMKSCESALLKAARMALWDDNVSIILCKIISGISW